jgi:hypothetical protein
MAFLYLLHAVYCSFKGRNAMLPKTILEVNTPGSAKGQNNPLEEHPAAMMFSVGRALWVEPLYGTGGWDMEDSYAIMVGASGVGSSSRCSPSSQLTPMHPQNMVTILFFEHLPVPSNTILE